MSDEATIFNEALSKESPQERCAYLDNACGGRTELRAQVEVLLAAHDRAGSFLESPAAGITQPAVDGGVEQLSTEGPGAMVGAYKLLEQIGEGGMGVVFMAEQVHPVRRRVALKIIKPGMDTRKVIARFEAERQALALMDHPNIAKVLEAGATAAGRPYFVMELVKGIPITEYCDQQKLSPRQRLGLFVQVCQAVQHAHQKGIIHRDLKPNNVLVTLQDGHPAPRVIDFGIAKATAEQHLTDQTLFTEFRQFVGTPLYMSPEQAEMSAPMDVDTRSDVYSLGVMLYELLTGTTPLDKQRLAKAAFEEVRRILREAEPPRLSTRLSTLGETLATVSANRRSDPKRLGQLMRGELDWIAMKALEKDRDRRYETPSALALDVERYLADEPVAAFPPGWIYRLRKYFRRHKGWVTTAIVLVVVLVLATSVNTWQAIRATRAWNAEAQQHTVAELARTREATQHSAALVQTERAMQSIDQLYTREGLSLLDQGQPAEAALWFIQAILANGSDSSRSAPQFLRVANALALAPRAVPPGVRLAGTSIDHFVTPGRYLRIINESDRKRFEVLIVNSDTHAPIVPPLRHELFVNFAAFSPDGRLVVSASSDRTARVWNASTGHPITPPLEHDGWVEHAAFSRDSARLATASDDFKARVWDVATGKQVGPSMECGGWVNTVYFNADGTRLLTSSTSGEGRLWDLTGGTGKVMATVRHESGALGLSAVNKAVFSPSEDEFVTIGCNGMARIVPIGGREIELTHDSCVKDVAFSPDGSALVTVSYGGWARVWSTGSGKPITAPIKHDEALTSCAFSHDGRWIATGSATGRIRILDAASGNEVGGRIQTSGEIVRIAFAADAPIVVAESSGERYEKWTPPKPWQSGVGIDGIVSQGYRAIEDELGWSAPVLVDHDVRAWDLRPLASPVPVVKASVGAPRLLLQILPSGRSILLDRAAKCVRVVDCATGAYLGSPLTDSGSVDRAEVSDSERLLASFNSSTNEVVVWSLESGAILSRYARPKGSPARSLQFSHDERYLLVSWSDGLDQQWELAGGGRPVPPELHHDGDASAARYAPGDQLILSTTFGKAQLWNRRTGEPAGSPMEHEGFIDNCGFDVSGSRIWTANQNSIRVWDAATQRRLIEVPSAHDSCAQFSPDGKRLLIKLNDSVVILDAESGQRVLPPLRPEKGSNRSPVEILMATFSSGGEMILTSDNDATVRVWDATTGQPIARFMLEDVGLACFSRDAKHVYAARKADGVGGAWALDPLTRDVEALRRVAECMSGQRIGKNMVLERLSSAEFRVRMATPLPAEASDYFRLRAAPRPTSAKNGDNERELERFDRLRAKDGAHAVTANPP